MKTITSRQNQIVAEFRAASGRRTAGDIILLDGLRLIEEALGAGIPITSAAATDERIESDADSTFRALESVGARVYAVSKGVMDAISPVSSPSGVVALARRPSRSLTDVLRKGPQLLVVPVDVQDPGNVGAIIRTAEAAGATGVVVAGASADPFGWKALRGSMGSAFRVPVAVERDAGSASRAISQAGVKLVAAVLSGGRGPADVDLAAPVAILVGGEGPGLSTESIERADERVSIPMRRPVESLNVAVAAALLLYEAARQRSG